MSLDTISGLGRSPVHRLADIRHGGQRTLRSGAALVGMRSFSPCHLPNFPRNTFRNSELVERLDAIVKTQAAAANDYLLNRCGRKGVTCVRWARNVRFGRARHDRVVPLVDIICPVWQWYAQGCFQIVTRRAGSVYRNVGCVESPTLYILATISRVPYLPGTSGFGGAVIQ